MLCCGKKKRKYEIDELEIPKYLLRAMFAWPENRTTIIRITGAVLQASTLLFLVPVLIYAFSAEAQQDGLFQIIQTLTDALALSSIAAKDYFIRKNAHEVLSIRKLLQEDFKGLERVISVPTVRTKRRWWPWVPTVIFIFVVGTNNVMTQISNWAGREHRLVMIKVPTFFLRIDAFYIPMMVTFVTCSIAGAGTYASADGLFIVFTSVLRDKAETLISALADVERTHPQQSAEEQDVVMSRIVHYHQLICQLHKTTEVLCNGQVLAMLFLVLFSIGALLIRIVYAGLSISEVLYVMFFLCWVFGQLNTYCMLGDTATTSVLKRSYSICSAILRLRPK